MIEGQASTRPQRGNSVGTIEWRRRRGAAFVGGLLLATWAAAATAQPLALPTARPADVGPSAERLARLDAAMQAEIDAGRKAGIVALIARRGRVAHLKAYGMAERESDPPMRPNSLLRLYSTTKPITSVALLMLYGEGKFQLSDQLDKYIPAFEDLQVLAAMNGDRMRLEPPRRKPTIHDVFRHTAGFSYGFDPQAPMGRAHAENGINFDTATSLKRLVAENLPKAPLLYYPGEQWVYSVAHDVQAYLVEVFSGMPFDEFCRERIFKPLGMNDATFGAPGVAASVAVGYGLGVSVTLDPARAGNLGSKGHVRLGRCRVDVGHSGSRRGARARFAVAIHGGRCGFRRTFSDARLSSHRGLTRA